METVVEYVTLTGSPRLSSRKRGCAGMTASVVPAACPHGLSPRKWGKWGRWGKRVPSKGASIDSNSLAQESPCQTRNHQRFVGFRVVFSFDSAVRPRSWFASFSRTAAGRAKRVMTISAAMTNGL